MTTSCDHKTAVEGRPKYRAGLTENQKRNIRDKASRYKVEQQCLYIVEDKDLGVLKKRRVVVKQDEKERILKATWFAVTSVMTGTTTTVWGSKKETCLLRWVKAGSGYGQA